MPTNMQYDRLPPYGEDLYQTFLDNPQLFSERQAALVSYVVEVMDQAQKMIDKLEKHLELLIETACLDRKDFKC